MNAKKELLRGMSLDGQAIQLVRGITPPLVLRSKTGGVNIGTTGMPVGLFSMQSDRIRKKFLDFFQARKHRIVEPDYLAPADDQTILFTPAGMNQFKKEFLGFDSGFKRAATCQRCLRTDDLDKVGKTLGHHTFFEMLGNFSFGDYFKKEAISFAWEFLVGELKLNEEKLWVSVYKDDTEADQIWRDLIKVPEAKIIKLADKENFWPSEAKELGPNGPCGPCSEIFYDLGKEAGCGKDQCNPSCDCNRFVEIWNLVFTQFNRKGTGILEPLPKKNIDTGMGLERLAAVMQGVRSNFQTDLFQPIIKEIIAVYGSTNREPRTANHELIYAIADHIRAIAFAIADGILPSNEARGYVIRKLIRKSALHLKALGIKEPFLYKLVAVLSRIMRDFYPQLEKRKDEIAQIILKEEQNFSVVLESSESLFEAKFKGVLKKQDPEEAGKIAFSLYDTHGIPQDLTFSWLRDHKINFSEEIFRSCLDQQKGRSKAKSNMQGDVFNSSDTDYNLKGTKFSGYKESCVKAKIKKIFIGLEDAKKVSAGENATIILEETCFYPESGGQVGDTGELLKGRNIFEVLDTKKSGKVILHLGKVKSGTFKNNDVVSSKIDTSRRLSIARNHTATHLLQAALRRVLGEHVKQQGSLVAEERLRFDFTHPRAPSKEELIRIEELVNSFIMEDYQLDVQQKTLAEAKKSGALAFFTEKYEAKVRIVSIRGVSDEFCGGTHLNRTGQIGFFKIIQEGSVASGVRRIEAVTGAFAYKAIKQESRIVEELSSILGVPAMNIIQELHKRDQRIKELEKKALGQAANSLEALVDADIKRKEEINGIYFVTHIGAEINELKRSVDLIKEKMGSNVFVAATTGENLDSKIIWVLGASEDLCQKGINAAELFALVALETGGSGGGRKDFAQGGGNNPSNFRKALEKLKQAIGDKK